MSNKCYHKCTSLSQEEKEPPKKKSKPAAEKKKKSKKVSLLSNSVVTVNCVLFFKVAVLTLGKNCNKTTIN